MHRALWRDGSEELPAGPGHFCPWCEDLARNQRAMEIHLLRGPWAPSPAGAHQRVRRPEAVAIPNLRRSKYSNDLRRLPDLRKARQAPD